MGRLLGAAVVPSAPSVLPTVAPTVPAADADDVTALRAAAAGALARLPDADAVVLLASGRRGVHAAARVDLASLGLPEVTREHPIGSRLLADVTSRTQFAQRHGDDLEVDLAVLALQLPAGTPVLPVGVAPADGDALVAIGRGIAAAIRDGDQDVTLLCAGDLSTSLDESSPRYHVEGAADWDAVTARAVREGDLALLLAQGRDAAVVHARSWAPLVVGLGVLRSVGLRPADVSYHAVRGVGHVVGSFTRP